MTSRQKVEAILEETDKFENIKHLRGSCPYPSEQGRYHESIREGQIGPDVYFTMESNKRERGSNYVDNGFVDLVYRGGEKLGRISMQGNFVFRDGYIHDQPSAETVLEVFSPRWQKDVGVMTAVESAASKISDFIKPLKVYHAKDETPDAVVDRMYNAVTLSQSKTEIEQITEKLSHLNLPDMKLRSAVQNVAQNLVQMIDAAEEQNTQKDDGRTL